jgi:hypothetical protein
MTRPNNALNLTQDSGASLAVRAPVSACVGRLA